MIRITTQEDLYIHIIILLIPSSFVGAYKLTNWFTATYSYNLLLSMQLYVQTLLCRTNDRSLMRPENGDWTGNSQCLCDLGYVESESVGYLLKNSWSKLYNSLNALTV